MFLEERPDHVAAFETLIDWSARPFLPFHRRRSRPAMALMPNQAEGDFRPAALVGLTNRVMFLIRHLLGI